MVTFHLQNKASLVRVCYSGCGSQELPSSVCLTPPSGLRRYCNRLSNISFENSHFDRKIIKHLTRDEPIQMKNIYMMLAQGYVGKPHSPFRIVLVLV